MALAVAGATSCVYDDEPQEQPEGPEQTLLSMSLSMPMAQAETGTPDGYVAGNENENYLDIPNDNYRIYFFDKEDKYITRFVPMGVYPTNEERTEYEVLGLTPADIMDLTDFKVVMLANWAAYPEPVAGSTTTSDLCEAAEAQYASCLTKTETDAATDQNLVTSIGPDIATGKLIPFFGLHHYTGVNIVKGKRTELNEPIAMLRAMAKIEVIVDVKGVSVTDIGLRGYNDNGYCAPAGIVEHGDYDHSGNWNLDYVKTPHLIEGVNETDSEKRFMHLLRRTEKAADGTSTEKWIAYVPEYRNTGAGDYKSRIEFKLDIQDTLHEIYFADYNTDGKINENPAYHDILRNNCYRFTVTLKGGILIIKTEQWENAYDNKFTFE